MVGPPEEVLQDQGGEAAFQVHWLISYIEIRCIGKIKLFCSFSAPRLINLRLFVLLCSSTSAI
jgi:hypothetical protein